MILEPIPELLENNYDKDSLIYNKDDHFYYNTDVKDNIIEDIINHNLQIYTGYYMHKKGWKSPNIYLIGRGIKSGKLELKIQNFKPYCYIPDKDGEYKHFLGENVEKIIFEGHPVNIKKYREKRKYQCKKTHEADIIFVRRFLCDMYDFFKSKEPIKPNVAIFDIETNFPVSDDIISYAINDSVNPIIYDSKFTTPNLYILALELYDKLIDYDIITGWNVPFDISKLEVMIEQIDRLLKFAERDNKLDRHSYINKYLGRKSLPLSDEDIIGVINRLFDLDYLRETPTSITLGDKRITKATTRHLFKYMGSKCAIIDLLPITKKMYGKQIRGKWELGNAGKQLCGTDKIHTGAKHIKDLDEETLLQYNVMDTIVPEIIDNTFGGIEAHATLCWSLQSMIEDVVITAIVSDISLLRKYHKEGVVLNSREHNIGSNSKEYKYDAAKPDARPGIYHDIITTDIVHAYPFSVISNNISPETKDPNGIHIIEYTNKKDEHKIVRYNDNRSIFVELLKYSVKQRTPIKETLNSLEKGTPEWWKYKYIDFAFKTESAALSHGMFGWEDGRVRDYDVADSITAVIRELIQEIKDTCDNINKPWIYAHTDSCYINAKKECSEKLLKYLNNIIQERYKESKEIPILEFKGYYPLGYIHSPARNVLIPEGIDIEDNENWDVTGMNFMRSEVPEYLGDIEIELIKMKLKDCSENDMIEYLKDVIKNMKDVDTTKLGLIKPLNKSISEYGKPKLDGEIGGIPNHISALLKATDEYDFDINVGEKFMILPILTDETVGKRKIRRKRVEMAFSIEEGLPKEYVVDFEYYLRSNLWGKIHNLFDTTPKKLEKMIMTEEILSHLQNNQGGK